MVEFQFEELFPSGEDSTDYRLISKDFVSTKTFEGKEMLLIEPEALTLLARTAFKDVSHLLRTRHLQQVRAVIDDPTTTDNDRYVALELIKNAVIAADGLFPLCQDTGTAIIMGKKGQQVWTTRSDSEALARGVFDAYTQNNLRYSQNAPISMYEEVNTGCNLPAQIDLYAVEGGLYSFLFIAKGGGSANKVFLFQETKAVLNPEKLPAFMASKMKTIGTAACPPYHLAFVVGGTSAEMNLKTVKLATAGYLDHLPTCGNPHGRAFRDKNLEEKLLEASKELKLGAQFGGKYFCLDTRVIRLPRHGASCPIGLGISCNADRNALGKISREGVYLEQLEMDPARFLPMPSTNEEDAVKIDLNQSMETIRSILRQYPVATRLKLSGKIIVARDIAHARIKERVDRGEGLPQYMKDHIIYYAGPAKIPEGFPSGSFGPTTAARMDPYVPLFQKLGGSMVMLAKGNRTDIVRDSCKTYGGFYLGSIGGPAARLGKECITDVNVLEYPELGMEAVHEITVKDFPAFILMDDKGNDFFQDPF
ncbi:MAG: fumarate hydratase [Desulfobacterales bacterium]